MSCVKRDNKALNHICIIIFFVDNIIVEFITICGY